MPEKFAFHGNTEYVGKKSPFKCTTDNLHIDRSTKAYYGLVPPIRDQVTMFTDNDSRDPNSPTFGEENTKATTRQQYKFEKSSHKEE